MKDGSLPQAQLPQCFCWAPEQGMKSKTLLESEQQNAACVSRQAERGGATGSKHPPDERASRSSGGGAEEPAGTAVPVPWQELPVGVRNAPAAQSRGRLGLS